MRDRQRDIQRRAQGSVGHPFELQPLGTRFGSEGDLDPSVVGGRQGQGGEPKRDLPDQKGRSECVPELDIQRGGLVVGIQLGVRRVIVALPGPNDHVGAVHLDMNPPQPAASPLALGMVAEEVVVRGLPGETVQGLGQVVRVLDGIAAGDGGQDLRSG